MMPRIYINFIVSIVFILIGCTPSKSNISIRIPSFLEYYPLLLKEAQNWQTDAYLDEVRIFLFPKSSDSYLISTSFFSNSKNLESLGVYLYQDRTITSEVFTHEYPVYHHKPITENDWKIDSQEALEYLLNQTGQRSVNPDNNGCSFIILKRILPAQNQPVIWSLTLWDCSDVAQYLYLDANSGELLDSSLINVKPTRFPTTTP